MRRKPSWAYLGLGLAVYTLGAVNLSVALAIDESIYASAAASFVIGVGAALIAFWIGYQDD